MFRKERNLKQCEEEKQLFGLALRDDKAVCRAAMTELDSHRFGFSLRGGGSAGTPDKRTGGPTLPTAGAGMIHQYHAGLFQDTHFPALARGRSWRPLELLILFP